jgi:hypothetical protein
VTGSIPHSILPTGLVQNPVADRRDPPGLLRDGQEVRGRHEAEFGVGPADQRFGTDDAASCGVELRLIVDLEVLLFQRVAQAFLDGDTSLGRGIHVVAIEVEAVSAALFRVVECRIGTLRQFLGLDCVARKAADACANPRRLGPEVVGSPSTWMIFLATLAASSSSETCVLRTATRHR